jgi:hypothetical protein
MHIEGSCCLVPKDKAYRQYLSDMFIRPPGC